MIKSDIGKFFSIQVDQIFLTLTFKPNIIVVIEFYQKNTDLCRKGIISLIVVNMVKKCSRVVSLICITRSGHPFV